MKISALAILGLFCFHSSAKGSVSTLQASPLDNLGHDEKVSEAFDLVDPHGWLVLAPASSAKLVKESVGASESLGEPFLIGKSGKQRLSWTGKCFRVFVPHHGSAHQASQGFWS